MAIKKTKTKKNKDEMGFSIDGQVYVWSTENGVTTETPLDPKVVLNCLIYVVTEFLKKKTVKAKK